MRTSWHDLWGCGRGPLGALSPQARLAAGAVLFAACLVAPATHPAGILLVAAAVAAWVAACRPPWRALGAFLMLGLALFAPYFLLAPLIPDGAGPDGAGPDGWPRQLAVPWAVFLRGLAGMLVSLATVASLSASDLRQALLGLPVPGVVSDILAQIVHQTGTLAYETRRVAAALAVRGASRGARTALRVLWSLPRVWLPRVLDRAERVAAAMEIRGYVEADRAVLGRAPWRPADALGLGLALAGLALAVALRCGAAA